MFPMTVRHVKKDERNYYEELLKYSREHLMLYPYHLSDIMVKGLRVTPFSYYISIMEVWCAFIPSTVIQTTDLYQCTRSHALLFL